MAGRGGGHKLRQNHAKEPDNFETDEEERRRGGGLPALTAFASGPNLTAGADIKKEGRNAIAKGGGKKETGEMIDLEHFRPSLWRGPR